MEKEINKKVLELILARLDITEEEGMYEHLLNPLSIYSIAMSTKGFDENKLMKLIKEKYEPFFQGLKEIKNEYKHRR